MLENELSEKQLFRNMELYDENNALYLSATGSVTPYHQERCNCSNIYSNATGRVSEEQLAKERRIAKQFDAVSEKVIGMTPWGAFYGLMISASRAGEGMFEHRVCIDPKDGRPVEVARSVAGRWVKSFIRPAHEYASEAASQKKWGQAAVHMAGHGWIINILKQRRLKSNCLEITPDEFIQEAKRRGLDPKPKTISPEEEQRRTQIDLKSIEEEKKADTISQTGIGLIIAAGIIVGAGITIYAVTKKN